MFGEDKYTRYVTWEKIWNFSHSFILPSKPNTNRKLYNVVLRFAALQVKKTFIDATSGNRKPLTLTLGRPTQNTFMELNLLKQGCWKMQEQTLN